MLVPLSRIQFSEPQSWLSGLVSLYLISVPYLLADLNKFACQEVCLSKLSPDSEIPPADVKIFRGIHRQPPFSVLLSDNLVVVVVVDNGTNLRFISSTCHYICLKL